jgi:hypothetical protein
VTPDHRPSKLRTCKGFREGVAAGECATVLREPLGGEVIPELRELRCEGPDSRELAVQHAGNILQHIDRRERRPHLVPVQFRGWHVGAGQRRAKNRRARAVVGVIVPLVREVYPLRMLGKHYRRERPARTLDVFPKHPVRQPEEVRCRGPEKFCRGLRLALPDAQGLLPGQVLKSMLPRCQHCDDNPVTGIGVVEDRAAAADSLVIRVWRDHQHVHTGLLQGNVRKEASAA